MPAADKAFYVTTPIYYVNDAPHIGHAYTSTAGDVLTRWHRQRGEHVWYLTGVDEHGTKVERAAAAGGVSPQEWVDTLVARDWLPVLHTIDAANDDFIRTTSERHVLGVQRFWEVLRENGYLFPAPYQGFYCVGCEEFKLAGDLVDGDGEFVGHKVCPIHGRPVEELEEENWFFRLTAFTDALIAHYEANPQAIRPASAYNEVMSFLRQGLVDISMSRSSVGWGIALPWDPNQVVYVWFDALLNYATAVGYGEPADSELGQRFARTWPADVHLVGKDILRFHAVYWPAMLLAAGLPLPGTVFAHGWLLVGGEKMSKTKLTGIAPSQIIDTFGSDAFRYYFLRAIAFGNDGSFCATNLPSFSSVHRRAGQRPGQSGRTGNGNGGQVLPGRVTGSSPDRSCRAGADRCGGAGGHRCRRMHAGTGLCRRNRRSAGVRGTGQWLHHRTGTVGPGKGSGQ